MASLQGTPSCHKRLTGRISQHNLPAMGEGTPAKVEGTPAKQGKGE